jgi:uncharacterized protein (DUF427 family)
MAGFRVYSQLMGPEAAADLATEVPNPDFPLMKAIYQGITIAESDATVVVEGNHYFPADSIKREFLRESDLHTVCPWKGKADYFHLAVEGHVIQDGVWVYPQAKDKAKHIEGYFAFYKNKGIQVQP